MKVIPPITVSDLNLTSSSVSEPSAPADYDGGTTYGLGAFATDSATLLVYQSLQSANTGNDPASSPLYWEQVGYKEVAYNPATSYGASTPASPVYVYSNHRIYQSLQGSNTGNNPYASPAWWQDIGPTLKYAMFDTLRNTASVAASPLTVVITPGQRIDALAALGLVADSIRVQMTLDGVSVYDQTQDLITRDVSTWYEYFFDAFEQGAAALFDDLLPYTSAVITVTFTRAAGNVEVGALCVGKAVPLGTMQYDSENDALNFSTVDRDTFGNATLIQRRSVPVNNITTMADADQVNDILAARTALNAVPAVWSGLDDDANDFFEAYLILGFYRKLTVAVEAPKKAKVTLQLEEI